MIDLANLRSIDLNLLVALAALVRERSVTRAGRVLGLSQPATSNTLARLRELLDDPVLVRTPAGMAPTPRALEVHAQALEALTTLAGALRRDVAWDPRAAKREFRVAGTDHAAFVLLPRLAQALLDEAPGCSLELVPWRGNETLAELQRGEVDLVLAIGDVGIKGPGLYQKRLFSDRFACLVRRGHPGVRGRLTLDEYVRLSHLLVSPRGGRTGLVDDALAKLGKRRHVGFVVPHFLLAPVLVSTTNYIVTLPERVALPFAELLPLDVHEPPVTLTADGWCCLWHERTHRDPAHDWLRRTLLALAAHGEDQLTPLKRSASGPSNRQPRRSRRADTPDRAAHRGGPSRRP